MLRRFSALWFGALLAAVIAACLSGVPVASAVDDDVVESTSNKNTGQGAASAFGVAFEKADETNKPVEVVPERTKETQTFANPDGTITKEIAQTPVFAKDDDGALKPIDADLVREGGRLEPKLADAEVSFSATGDGAVSSLVTRTGDAVSFSLLDGGLQAPRVAEDVATYAREGVEGESVQVASTATGFTTRVLLAERPVEQPVYRFRVDAGGLDVALDGQKLTFRDGAQVVAESSRLQMWDAEVDAAGSPEAPVDVAATLVQEDGGPVLELRPSMDWLSDEARQYPVTVDPDVKTVTPGFVGDTWIFDGQRTDDSRGSAVDLRVGSADGDRRFRSLLYYRYKNLGALTVTKATIQLHQFMSGAPGCAEREMLGHPMLSDDQSRATWTTQPTYQTSVIYESSTLKQRGVRCPVSSGTVDVDVTAMVSAWAGGQQNGDDGGQNRQAVMLRTRADKEKDTSYERRFCSEDWNSSSPNCGESEFVPKLTVTYEPEIGSQSWYSTTDHTFNDRSNLSVNNRNGNAMIQNTDATIKGVGQDLAIQRIYNSQSDDADTTFGPGWNLGLGPDVWLDKRSNWRRDYHGPSTTVLGSFRRNSSDISSSNYRKYLTPVNGAGAELEEVKNSETDKWEFVLKFRKSPQRYKFAQFNADGDAFLTQIYDRSGNKITFTYSGFVAGGKRPKLTNIRDTVGRDYAVNYEGDRITTITEDAGRTGSGVTRSWSYGYAGGQLTSFTDAMGATWTYGYDSSNRLTSIDGPGDANTRTETRLAWRGDTKQLTSARYRLDNDPDPAKAFANYSFSYTEPPKCSDLGSKSVGGAQVTNPMGRNTKYCFGARDIDGSPYETWVYDALDHRRNQQFSVDNNPMGSTSAMGAQTASTYSKGPNGSTAERLDKVTQPKNDGSGESDRLSSSFGYNDDTASAGYHADNAYLPSNARTASNDCNGYTYDSAGRTTKTTSGFAATNGSCKTGNPDATFERTYDDKGNVVYSWDGSAGTNPTNDDKTYYTYWKPGESGYVNGTEGLMKTFRKPGGNCDATLSSRKLCTSYTYDGAGRTATMTDGRGKVTSYRYDRNDRTTGVFYNGSSERDCTASSTSCLTYDYDAEGNMTKRTNGDQESRFTFDRANRPLEVITPGNDAGNDKVTTAYFPNGLTKGYTEQFSGLDSHQVEYDYDIADRLKTVTDAGEVMTVTNDEDDRITKIVYPKSNGLDGASANYAYSKNGKPTEFSVRDASGDVRGKVKYSYKSGTKDTSQLQKRTVTDSWFADQNGEWTYEYAKQRLVKATSTNNTSYAYDYDKIGNLTTEKVGDDTTYFRYDKVGQLCFSRRTTVESATPLTCGTTPSAGTTYTSDKAGNSHGSSDNSYEVNDRNQVTTIDGTTMTYLDQGNDLRRTNDGRRELNGAGGVTAIRTEGPGVTATTTYIVRGPDGRILAHRTNGSRTYNYLTEPGSNSVSWLTSPDGAVIGGYRYAPYGKAATYTRLGDTNAQTNRFRWLGQHLNADTTPGESHYKFGARYYDQRGHFTQPDPLTGGMTDPRTMSNYNYAGGDPINQHDISGMASQSNDLCRTNTGYSTPPGCAYNSGWAAEPGYSNNGGGKRVFNDYECAVNFVGGAVAYAQGKTTKKEVFESVAKKYAARAVPVLGQGLFVYTTYEACIA